ncbi:MAG: penicillin-insensitive murein endopeptidase [Myxococcota bacterium]
MPTWTIAALAFASTAWGQSRPYYAGYQLPPADGLYERWDPRRSWGAQHMVEAMQQVANRVAFQLPLADPILIGDISRRGGGPLPGHQTHHLGIDVDIGLFMGSGQQPLGGPIDLLPHELDVASNWVLITALLDTGQVQYMLLDRGHIEVLRDYALEEVGLDLQTVDQLFPPRGTPLVWRRRGVIRHAPNHKSHLHVRLTSAKLDDSYTEDGTILASDGTRWDPSSDEGSGDEASVYRSGPRPLPDAETEGQPLDELGDEASEPTDTAPVDAPPPPPPANPAAPSAPAAPPGPAPEAPSDPAPDAAPTAPAPAAPAPEPAPAPAPVPAPEPELEQD